MIVRELLTRLGFVTDTSGAKRYDNALGGINNKAVALTSTLQGMMAAAAAAFSVKAIANTLDQVASLEAKIAQLPQTVGKSGDAFNYLVEKANASRQPIEAYMTLYTRIGYATKELLPTQQALSGVIDTISQSFVMGGSAASEQAAAMLQLSQAFNKGKLDGDEFRSVMENMPGQVTQSLAEAMGYLTKGELMKASSDGKLVVDELVKGFQKIGPEIEKSFMKMPLTIGQATSIASNKWARFLAKMNRESGAVTWMLGLFNKLVDGLEKFGDASIKFFGSSTNLVKFLAIAITAVLLPALTRLAVSMAAFLLSPTGLLLTGLIAIGVMLEDIYQWTQDNESMTGKWIGTYAKFKESVITMWGELKTAFNDAIDHFVKHWTDKWDSIKNTTQQIVDQISALVPDWIKDLFGKGADIAVNISGEVSDKVGDVQSKFVNPNKQQGVVTSPQAAAAMQNYNNNKPDDHAVNQVSARAALDHGVNNPEINPVVKTPSINPIVKQPVIRPEIKDLIIRPRIDPELINGMSRLAGGDNITNQSSSVTNMAHVATSNVNNSYGSPSVNIGDINVSVSNTNATAQDIAKETASAVAARARVGGLSSMGLK